jgi:hypothetical protein
MPISSSLEVAARIFRPRIAGHLLGAHARVAAADVEMDAGPAAAADRARMRLEAGHQRVAGIHPDLAEAERSRTVAERVMPPHRVRMDVAQVVDVGDVHAAGIAAPLRELAADVPDLVREAALQPVQQVNAVGIVVAGGEFLDQPALLDISQQVSNSRSMALRVIWCSASSLRFLLPRPA